MNDRRPCFIEKFSLRDVRYVFLDRDGVINRNAAQGDYVCRLQDFQVLPGVEAAIASLNRSGRRVIVITNQRGVALGRYTCSDINELHDRLQEHLRSFRAHIDAFYVCPHDIDQCDCRKPRTGLFRRAFRDFPDATSTTSVMVGDSISDMKAARDLNMPAIFIAGNPVSEHRTVQQAVHLATAVCRSLLEAVEQYLP